MIAIIKYVNHIKSHYIIQWSTFLINVFSNEILEGGAFWSLCVIKISAIYFAGNGQLPDCNF